jgi:hypothetical protein
MSIFGSSCSNCSGENKNQEGCPYVEEHLEMAANAAAKKVFSILGVDIDSPKEVEEFRDNLRFGETMRKVAERGAIAFTGAAVTTIFAAFWTYIVDKLNH